MNNLNDFVSILYPTFSGLSSLDPRIIVFNQLLSLFIKINTEYPDLLQILINFNKKDTDKRGIIKDDDGNIITLNTYVTNEIKKMSPQPKPQQTPQPAQAQTSSKYGLGLFKGLVSSAVGTATNVVVTVFDKAVEELRSKIEEEVLDDIWDSLSRLNTKYPHFFINIIKFNQLDQDDKGIITHNTFLNTSLPQFIPPTSPPLPLDKVKEYIITHKHLTKEYRNKDGSTETENINIDFKAFIKLLNKIPFWCLYAQKT